MGAKKKLSQAPQLLPPNERPSEGELTEPEAVSLISQAKISSSPLSAFRAPMSPFRLATSLQCSDESGKKLLYRCLTSQDMRLAENLDREWQVRDWVMHDVAKVDDAGEVEEWVRTVLILEDGARVSCGSGGLVNGLDLYAKVFRPAPWDPPLVCRIVPQQSRQGRTFYVLDPI